MARGEVAAGAVLTVARQRLRRRRVATGALLVLAGLGAAAPLALWSASRQTATGLDRFVERADVPTTQVFICPPRHDPVEDGPDRCFEEPEPSELAAVRAVPGASAAATFSFHPVTLRTARADTGTLPAGLGVAALHGGGSTATVAGNPVIVSGRLASPTAADEVMVTEPGARSLGVGTGDRVTFVAPVLEADAPGPPAEVEAEVVGVVRTPADLLPLPLEAIGGPAFHARAGWFEAHGGRLPSYTSTAVWLGGGDVDAFVEGLRARLPDQEVVAEPVIPVGEMDTLEHATSLESRAGMALAATAAAAVAFFVGQAVSRQSRAEAADGEALTALGMTRRQLLLVTVVRWLPAALGAVVLAVAVAWAASALGPLGVARRGIWDRSPFADWTVLGVGAAATFGLFLVAAGIGSLRRSGSGGGTAARAASVGPPGLRTGIGLAWASVRRGAVLPLVSAVVATALAMAAVVAAAGGAASLRLVTDEPRRFGAPWDALVSGGGGFASTEEAAEALSAVPEVASVAGIAGTDVAIAGDEQVWAQALVPVGDLPTTAPVIVSGRAPASDREIALGSVTMDDAGARVGEEVRLEVPAGDEPLPFRVVGVAMVTDGFEPNVGDGALLTPDGLARLDPAALAETELGIAVEDGPGREAALVELRRAVPSTITPFPVPSSLANAERIAELPLLLATGAALLAAITFVHALITSVRRNRRELAVCRVLGFTRRQVHSAVATQATVLALAAVAIGLPLGVIGARWGWRAMARAFGVATGPLVPVWIVVAAGVATVVVANLAAGPPSRWMTRRQPAEALRTE
jgi:hypothetical protein